MPVGSTTKKVFAHYFPPYPVSLDNKATSVDYYTRNYLNPAGENGKFQSLGGLLRDRPMGRPVLTGDYKLADAVTEVKQASGAGIDGFLVNIMNWSGSNWDASLRMSAAAAQSGTGFVVAPNIDMTSSAASAPISTMAASLAQFYGTSGAYRLPDGRYVLSTFKAEAKPASYWRELITTLKSQYGIDVAWVGVLLSINDAQIAEYAPISYALGTWGARDADLTLRNPNRAVQVHKLGVKWMTGLAVQDVRHTQLRYAESGNTELLRASWSRAISDGADFVQMITWNDYSESTSFAPSANHQKLLPRRQRLLRQPVQERHGPDPEQRRARGHPPHPEGRHEADPADRGDGLHAGRQQDHPAGHRRGAEHAEGSGHGHPDGGQHDQDGRGPGRDVDLHPPARHRHHLRRRHPLRLAGRHGDRSAQDGDQHRLLEPAVLRRLLAGEPHGHPVTRS